MHGIDLVKARFWGHVKIGSASGCWPWKRFIAPNGYGRFKWNGAIISAHRFAYLASSGSIPDGQLVLHHCDNKSCCNPIHLYLGTHQDNMNDGKARNRFNSPVGEAHGMHTLTAEDVEYAKQKSAKGWKQNRIAKVLGVNQSTVSRIVNGKRWGHLSFQ